MVSAGTKLLQNSPSVTQISIRFREQVLRVIHNLPTVVHKFTFLHFPEEKKRPVDNGEAMMENEHHL